VLKRGDGGYSVNMVVLEDGIKISCFLIPRFLFYAIFQVLLLITELTVLQPISDRGILLCHNKYGHIRHSSLLRDRKELGVKAASRKPICLSYLF